MREAMDDLWKGLILLFMIAVVVAFLLGITAAWGIPKVWAWLKPIIHVATS
jgi:hypothetical protein